MSTHSEILLEQAEATEFVKFNKTLYSRQKTLKLDIPDNIAVIGIGGVGSWVAVDFALSGVNNITVVDNDIVELSNLNRTPFTLMDNGRPKVIAVMEHILERRNCNITPIQDRVENLETSLFDNCKYIFDCRDVSTSLHKDLQKKVVITGGYNGTNVTIHINPSGNAVWGEGNGYSIIPSWLVPPKIISTIIVTYIMCVDNKRTEEYFYNFNVSEMVSDILKVKEGEKNES